MEKSLSKGSKDVSKLTIALPLAAILSLSACASQNAMTGEAKIERVSSYQGGVLPKPDQVLVRDFRMAPEVITIDDSMSARLHSHLNLLTGAGEGDQSSSQAVAQQVQATFSKALLTELKKGHVSARPEAGYAPAGHNLIVRGEFTGIDEGNRSKRVMVGFGRGASDVQAHVTLLLTGRDGAPPVVVSEFTVNSESGQKPGAVVGLGFWMAAVGAATGSIGDKKSTVEGDAARMGESVARQIEKLMVAYDWIAPEQLPLR